MKAFAVALLWLIALSTLAIHPHASADELTDRLAAVPNPRIANGWVADPANLIAARHADINGLLTDLEQRTSVEVAVVILPTIGQLVPKDFAVALFQHWGIGKAGKDNGLLVLHVLDQRRIEIETGYGMEGVLPDVKCFWITEEVAVPFFKQGSFADGHYEVVRALIRGVEQPEIKRVDLLSPWITKPGDSVDAVPTIPEYDTLGLKYASPSERTLHSRWTPWVLIAIGALIYVAVMFIYRWRAIGMTPYDKYQLFAGGVARLQYASALPVGAAALVAEYSRTDTFFSAVPALVAALLGTGWRRKKTLRALRDAPRKCECGKTMQRVSEREDDAYLEKGNVAEEDIQSMDYDVWKCACGRSMTEAYKGNAGSGVMACPVCTYKTFRVTSRRTVRAATTASTGLEEITYSCQHCRHSDRINKAIERVGSSSSGSGGSSSSRSSGSFGGGRSGGGGAGSSY
jgi:uncharacterized protein